MSPGPEPLPDRVSPGLGRQPALDGLRGGAILLVVVHNFKWPGFSGGFIGVDIFFALSGFLITTLLLEEHARHGRISLRGFFTRRFLRLYPALVVLMGFALVSLRFDARSVPFSRVAAVTASVLGYWSNWFVIADPQAWFGGLHHTWSLAVEMQFYLLWSLVVVAVTRRRGCDWRLLARLAAGLAAGSALWRAGMWSLGHDTQWLYGGTDMRLDAIFLGVVASLLRWRHLAEPSHPILPALSRGLVWLVELAAVLVLIVLVTSLTQESAPPYLGGFTAAGGAAAVLILTTLLYPGSLAARVAAWPVLVWLGQVSYSLYLWHVPAAKVLSSARLAARGIPPVPAGLIQLGASLALAAASYYGIERYFLRLKDRWPGQRQVAHNK